MSSTHNYRIQTAPSPTNRAITMNDNNTSHPSSAGTDLVIYGAGSFVVILLLFGICVGADAAGRRIKAAGKRMVLANGTGNVSLMTEIVVFVLVLFLVGILLSHSFKESRIHTQMQEVVGSEHDD